jgi:hypothetical protein
MIKRNPMWSVSDFSNAMKNAILGMASPKLIKQADNKISFNGFWRNGDKQNVCIWLDKATWHDAKTGEGGGCKEFAKAAFNMNLTEFMNRFALATYYPTTALDVSKAFKGVPQTKEAPLSKSIENIFKELCRRDKNNQQDRSKTWLEVKRGLINPRLCIGSGFANLSQDDVDLFEKQHQSFIRQRLIVADQMVVPLRGVNSDRIENLFFRSITECPKEEKSRLLPNAGGWTEPDGSPRAFGFPHLIKEFPHLVLCEGMADYFAVEFLINQNKDILPIGAANADGLSKWANQLVMTRYKGKVTVLHQLDMDEKGRLNTKEVGVKKAIEALRQLKENQVHAQLFDWPFYLNHTSSHPSFINDIADSLSTELTYKECGPQHLQETFLLSFKLNKGL